MRDELLEFELALDLHTSEEVVEHEWGRAFLSPSLPLVWDANWILVERRGMSLAEVLEAGDGALGGYAHRTIAIYDEDEGERLAAAVASEPDWTAGVNLYMLWSGASASCWR